MAKAYPQVRMFTLSALALLLLATGCASKKYVREEIAKIDPKIVAVSNQVKENAERIDQVDRRAAQGISDAAGARGLAQTAQTAAQGAQTSANTANTAAQTASTAAATAQRGADTANQGVGAATTRITALENRQQQSIVGLDNYAQSGPVQKVLFATDSDTLSAEAKQALDAIAGQVKGLKGGYMLEVQGFADPRGTEKYNITLSQLRAESVLRYLVSQGVALGRVTIVGLGETEQFGDAKSAASLSENRRVEVKVLRSPLAN